MKKFFKLTAAALAVGMAATLAGCGGCAGCAGCSGNSANHAVTDSNWYTGTTYKGIQPSFIVENDPERYTKEVIDYDVSYTKLDANATYSADYKDGSYQTEFYAFNYDWNGNPVYSRNAKETLYCYVTRFEISVQFTFKATGEQSAWFKDSTTSVCYFRAAGKNLQPVYSKQEIKSTSPANYQAASLKDTYRKIDLLYENYYNYEFTEVTSESTEVKEESPEAPVKDTKIYTGLDREANSIFDNNSLYIAVRSMKLSPSFSQNISLFTAAAGGVAQYTVSGSDATLGEDDLKTVSDEMQRNNLFVPESEDSRIPSVAVNVNYTGGALYGTTQTIWYAAINADNNTARTTMLKLSVPLSYSLGTLNFTLKNINSTLWNE